MAGSLKGAGLALMLAALLGVVMTSGAAAEHFVSETESTTLEGEQEGAFEFLFGETFGSCTNVRKFGKVLTATTTEITAEAIIEKPCWKNDKTHKSDPTLTVNWNGCDFKITVLANAGIQSTHLFCQGKKIEIASPDCTYSIPAQTPSGGVELTTTVIGGKHALTVDVSLEKITYERHSGICIFLGTNGTNGKILGTFILRGYNASGEPVGITAT